MKNLYCSDAERGASREVKSPPGAVQRHQPVAGTTVAESAIVKQRAREWYFTVHTPTVLSIALLGLGFAGIMALGTAAPVWKIGRAVFEFRPPPGQTAPGQGIPVLKLSLRNEGAAGNLPVQIFGRWTIQSAPPQSFVLLGTYQREVALTRTAILEAPLTGLTGVPAGLITLEVVVTTAGIETDRKSIPWN